MGRICVCLVDFMYCRLVVEVDIRAANAIGLGMMEVFEKFRQLPSFRIKLATML